MTEAPDDLPVMVYDWSDPGLREIAENIWHAPREQQDAQRDLMNRFYREHGAYRPGAALRFEVRVVNHPRGRVVAPGEALPEPIS